MQRGNVGVERREGCVFHRLTKDTDKMPFDQRPEGMSK